MGRKAKYSKELKLTIINRYLKGESASALANEYGMPKSVGNKIREWVHKYEAFGEKEFNNSFKIKHIQKSLKKK